MNDLWAHELQRDLEMSDDDEPAAPTSGSIRKLSRKRIEKKESLNTYADLCVYRMNIQRLVNKKKKELDELKIDEKADILEQKNDCNENEYYCQICKYRMPSKHTQVHEFMHAVPQL